MSPVKILVVEDEFIVAADLTARLKKLGYQVVGTAASGLEAIEKVWRESPSLVLMDIVLKGEMNGIATAETIKKGYNIPIIFLTAYADRKTFTNAQTTEPFGYICKPFQEKNLQMAIEIALQRHGIETQHQQQLAIAQQERHESQNKINKHVAQVSRTIYELQTPITTLLASIKLLEVSQGQTETELTEKYFRLIKSSGDKIENLVEDILLLAKAEKKQLEFAPEAIDLARFCRNYLEEIQVGSQTSQRFILLCPNLPSIVYLDAKLLQTILSNLMANAIKYSPIDQAIVLKIEYQENYVPSLENNSISSPNQSFGMAQEPSFGTDKELSSLDSLSSISTIAYAEQNSRQDFRQESRQNSLPQTQDTAQNEETSLEFSSEENHDLQDLFSPYIIIQIKDYGMGIPEGEQNKIFHTFYRCSNVAEVSGTGLGLAIVKHAVKLHGGSISFTSKEGEGSTFTVALPCGT
jgi:signal transduction histidine kinase